MDRRKFLTGALAVPAAALMPTLPPALGADLAAAESYTGEAVFIRTGPGAWRCIKSGYLGPDALPRMLRMLDLLPPVRVLPPGVRPITQYVTMDPAEQVHDSVCMTIEHATDAPIPPTNTET